MMYNNWFSEKEVAMFAAIKDVEIVIDVGVKDNIEYIEACPTATYHLFEPNPLFYEKIKGILAKREFKNIVLNNVGVGEKKEEREYFVDMEYFVGSEANPVPSLGLKLPVINLDDYIKEKNITKIDFLKIDAEGMDYEILKYSPLAVSISRYLQYEYWHNQDEFRTLLSPQFELEDIGGRNIFCKNTLL